MGDDPLVLEIVPEFEEPKSGAREFAEQKSGARDFATPKLSDRDFAAPKVSSRDFGAPRARANFIFWLYHRYVHRQNFSKNCSSEAPKDHPTFQT